MSERPGVRFDAATHSYWSGGVQLRSVTSVVKTVVPGFDSAAVAAKVATKRGVAAADVLAEWEAKGEAVRALGSRVHAYAEDVLNGVSDPVAAAINDKAPEMAAFDAAWDSVRTKLGATVAAVERVVWSSELGLAGRIDTLLDVAGRRCVFDWKTGKFAAANRYERLLPPFDDLDHCELNVYSLQQSLYRVLLERSGEPTGDAYLVHLSRDGAYHAYRARDLRARAEMWVVAC